MKRKSRLAAAIVALACLLWAGPALAAKDYRAERFDVVLDLQPDGAVIVTETVRFRFEGGPFTYAFRDLAYTEIDEIDRLQAGMDGAVLPQGTGPGQVEIVAGRPLKVTWHFAPTSDSVHEFVLAYRVQGAIRREAGADALIWRAIPEDHDYPIEQSTITLLYPASSPLVGEPELSGARSTRESGDGRVQWAATGIRADESAVVTARFSAGRLVQVPPQWQSRQAEQQVQKARGVQAALAAGLLTLAAGAAALAAFLLRQRRTRIADRAAVVRVSTPPDEAPPGMAVQLAGRGTPAVATLFDLANRGVVRIEERGKGFLGAKKYTLDRLPADTELRPHEEGLLRAIFEKKEETRDSLPLSEVGRRLASHTRWYRDPLEQEMEDAGLLDPRRKAARNGLLVAGVAAVLVGGAMLVAGAIVAGVAGARGAGSAATAGAVAAGAGVALLLLGLAALIAGAAFSPLSEPGDQAATAWKGFGAYLKDIVRGREFASGEALFERYLPLAAGLGLGERWARYAQKQGFAAVPGWFGALQEAGDGDFDGVIAVIVATDSSFSSGGSGAAGAAGASGGGASGAG